MNCGRQLSVLPAWAASAVVVFLLTACAGVQIPGLPKSAAAEQETGAARPAGTAGLAAAEATVGGQKAVVLSTFEGDLGCTQMVAPFAISDNMTVLTDLAAASSVKMAGTWIEDLIGGRSGRTAINAGRYSIPYDLRIAALRLNWLPMTAELAYGRMVLDKMRDDLLERDSELGRKLYPLADALLADILKGVLEPHSYRFEMYIRTSSGDNALALPGGLIVIDAALIQDINLKPKAYFAVAHEIGHVLQRHETRALQARIIDTVALGGSASDLLHAIRATGINPKPLFDLVLAGKLQFERHFGDQEMHADGCGVRALDIALANDDRLAVVVQSFVTQLVLNHADDLGATAAGPAGNSRVPKSTATVKLEQAAQDAKSVVTLVTRPIDRHPAPADRIANLNRTLAEIHKRPGKTPAKINVSPAVAGKKGQTIRVPAPAVPNKK